MKQSNKAISLEDLQDAYLELLKGKNSLDLFNDISSDREHKFILENQKQKK